MLEWEVKPYLKRNRSMDISADSEKLPWGRSPFLSFPALFFSPLSPFPFSPFHFPLSRPFLILPFRIPSSLPRKSNFRVR